MKLFKRATPSIELPVFVECRSWHGVSFHVRDTRDETGLALCGYAPLDDRGEITPARLEAALPMQHEGFKYCSSCRDLFLLTSSEA